ncbi:PIG-L deacetylase family protein [Planctomicrobium sp. SH661]|uniref:PIG-L deacetylase family protein n=1 Tax=Planctomicrobium sp. SH661 TaxID=3448124 RepID=UPI003F5CA270
MKRVLVLAGHGDDSVIALGATLASVVEQGGHVAVVCFGNGDEAFGRMEDRPGIIEQFHEQAIAAHQQLGITDFQCLGLTDFEIREDRNIYRECIRAIRRVQPDVILTHDWLEYFQHRAMARMATDAWWQAGWKCSADLGEPWAARRLYRFEVLHSMPEPTHLVDVSSTFEKKIAAIREFKAAQEFLTELVDQLEARARFHGSKIGVKYAEALTRSYFIPEATRSVNDL